MSRATITVSVKVTVSVSVSVTVTVTVTATATATATAAAAAAAAAESNAAAVQERALLLRQAQASIQGLGGQRSQAVAATGLPHKSTCMAVPAWAFAAAAPRT